MSFGFANRIPFFLLLLSLFTFLSSAVAEVSPKCPGEKGYRFLNNYDGNPTTGGFVSNSADVDVTVRIAPSAAVCGSASVLDQARVYGHAVVSGEAVVEGNARVFGNARIEDHAIVRENASVSGNAIVSGDALIEGDAVVRGWYRNESEKIDSGLYAPDSQPEEEVKHQQLVKFNAKRFCDEELVNQCLRWEECDGFTKGKCAEEVIHDFNKVIAQCHENKLYEKIRLIEPGVYKRYIIINDKKYFCNSDEKKERVKQQEDEKVEDKVDEMALWCDNNTPTSIVRREKQCKRKCDQMTGFNKTPRAYYDACMNICEKNKKIRLARFDKRCQITDDNR